MYTYLEGNLAIVRFSDGATIPCDAENTDYQTALAWVAEGNAIAPYKVSAQERSAKVDAIRDERLYAPLTWNGKRWDADERSRALVGQRVAMLNAGLAVLADFAWRSFDNVMVPMTAADLVALGTAMTERVQACYAHSWQLKAQLAAAADPSTVDLESGWPA